MRQTSLIEWPAWLKCSDSGVVVLSCTSTPELPSTNYDFTIKFAPISVHPQKGTILSWRADENLLVNNN